MMKKILLILTLCMTIATAAMAQVRTEVEQGEKYKWEYPVVTLASPLASARINNDIAKELAKAKKLLNDPEQLNVGTYYKVPYEDDNYLNITWSVWNYTGGAHGMYVTSGIVYDKATGKRVPYTHFHKEMNAKQMKKDIMEGKLTVYCADLQTISKAPFITYEDNFQVSDNYILDKDGRVYLLYQPYELDSYAAGTTYVLLP